MISGEGHRVCLTDVGLTRVAGDLGSNASVSTTSTTNGGYSVRWSPPEQLDPERFGSNRRRPTKKSDMYSMAMTIYQVSSLQYRPAKSIEMVLGFDGQSPIPRLWRASGNAPNHQRRATPKTGLRPHPRLHRGPVGNDNLLLERGSH